MTKDETRRETKDERNMKDLKGDHSLCQQVKCFFCDRVGFHIVERKLEC